MVPDPEFKPYVSIDLETGIPTNPTLYVPVTIANNKAELFALLEKAQAELDKHAE